MNAVVNAVETPTAIRRRMAIVLAAAEPETTYGDVAKRTGQSAKTVGVVVRRFREYGPAGLYRTSRKGTTTDSLTGFDAEILRVVRTPPPEGEYWSLRSLATVLERPKSTVARQCAALGIDLKIARKSNLAPLPAYDGVIGFMFDPPIYAVALQLCTNATRAQAKVPVAAVVAALDVAVVARTLDRPRHRTHETLQAFITAIRTDPARTFAPASVFVAGYRPSHGRDVVQAVQLAAQKSLTSLKAVSFDTGMRNFARIAGAMGHRTDGRCPERFGKLVINRITAAGEAARDRGVCVFWVHKNK